MTYKEKEHASRPDYGYTRRHFKWIKSVLMKEYDGYSHGRKIELDSELGIW